MNEEVPISNQDSDSSIDESSPLEASSIEEKSSDNKENNKQSITSDESEPKNTPSTEARLEQLEKEHETLRGQYMRIAADFDNFRKRQSRDQDDLKIQLKCTTLSEILPVVDNFERARQQINPEGEEAQALHRNYQNLYKQLVDSLKKLGVAPMRVEGQSFDPTLHEALMREPSEDYGEDMILEELVRGYHLNGRVLRHAQVKVSMGPGPTLDSAEEKTDEDSQSENDASSQHSIDAD